MASLVEPGTGTAVASPVSWLVGTDIQLAAVEEDASHQTDMMVASQPHARHNIMQSQ